MANRLETHVWFDGDCWRIYTERAADIARFAKWFGHPTRLAREGACAHWDAVPADALRVRRKANRGSRTIDPNAIAGLKAYQAARRASKP